MLGILEQRRVRQWLGCPDIAIDLGTANTRLFALGQGLVAEEPSLVTIQSVNGRVAAVGREAMQLALERSETLPLAPLHSGVVADVKVASTLLRYLMERIERPGLLRPRALVCAPTDVQKEEREMLIEATRLAGASAVAVAPEPLAAAIGAGLDVASPYAQMLVDIGDGVTDLAIIRSGELVQTSAVRIACSDLHRAISRRVAVQYGIQLSPLEAERLTCRVSHMTECSEGEEKLYLTQGIDLATGEPVSLSIQCEEILGAVEPVFEEILQAIVSVVENLPPDTSCEVIESGICVSGGGALLPRLTQRLERRTSMDVYLAHDPLRSVILGAQLMLQVGAETGMWRHQ